MIADNELKDITQRKGFIIFDRDFILYAEKDLLQTIFNNFFPIAIDPYHCQSPWSKLRYYCLSPFFKQIEKGDLIPEYELEFKQFEDGPTIISDVRLKQEVEIDLTQLTK